MLYDKLRDYEQSDYYPFHMPGHKRSGRLAEDEFWQSFYGIDITEIDDFDNLHDASGVIKDVENHASRIYGADETHLLIGGSTVGVLAAISGVVPRGGHLLMTRDSHKSAYHAVMLREIRTSYAFATRDEGLGLNRAVTLADIKEVLDKDDTIDAVFITSPTYEGYVADVRAIADYVHSKGIPLIVDEAHGAHFGLADFMPGGSISCGADVVIHSLHKTLPSPTMTGLLHIRSDFSRADRVREFLKIYQSSSPSYVLMAGIDRCLKYIDGATGDWESFYLERKNLSEALRNLKNLKVRDFFTENEHNESGMESYKMDICKMLVCAKNGARIGKELHSRLVGEYHLQPEMSMPGYVLLFLTIGDDKAGYDRLINALYDIDNRYEEIFGETAGTVESYGRVPRPVKKYEIYEAMEMQLETVDSKDAIGRVVGQFITVYPPGQPVVVPGEIIQDVTGTGVVSVVK